MSRPKLTRANCEEIRNLRWDENNHRHTPRSLAALFGVTAPTIETVLAGKYRPLEDYLLAQYVTCKHCGGSFHPSTGIYDNVGYTGWYHHACLAAHNAPPPAPTPKRVRRRVYAYVTNENIQHMRAVRPGEFLKDSRPVSKNGDFSQWCHGKRATLAMLDGENSWLRRSAHMVCELFGWLHKYDIENRSHDCFATVEAPSAKKAMEIWKTKLWTSNPHARGLRATRCSND